MRTLSKHLSDAIMVLVAFLFPRSLLGVTIDHIAKGARKDHEDEDQEDERLIMISFVVVLQTRVLLKKQTCLF